MSFVRSPDDAQPGAEDHDRRRAARACRSSPRSRSPRRWTFLPDIVDAFDGIMVARGDLGVELPLEQVPTVQTRAIKLARERARPVIVATQMLESMISAPRPTRAEVSDVAGAVSAGADAVMLSAETGVGAYPIETVATMSRIIVAAEESSLRRRAPPVADADHHRRGHRPRGGRGRRDRRGQGPGRVHADRRDGAPPGPVPLPDPADGLHHQPGHPQPARPDLGRRDVRGPDRATTPTRWCTRSTRPWSR